MGYVRVYGLRDHNTRNLQKHNHHRSHLRPISGVWGHALSVVCNVLGAAAA